MIRLDTRSREPIYTQIEKQIIKLINLGVYEVNSPLPSVRSVAFDLGINPNTVAKAYKNLEKNEVVYSISGKGVFVNSNNLSGIHKIAAKDLCNAITDAKNAGIEKETAIEIIERVWRDESND